MINKYDIVELTENVNPKILKGMTATVLEIFENGDCEIEVVDRDGRNIQSGSAVTFTVSSNQIKKIQVSYHDDNSLRDNHPLILFAKAQSWIKLFLFPVFSAILVCAIIISNSSYTWSNGLIITILSIGAILGIWFATRMGKKHGLIEIDTEISKSRDIDEWISKQKKRRNLKIPTFH